jgi:hypothetical protein
MMQFRPAPALGGIPMKTNLLFGRFWSGNRRVNRCRLAVEPMEERLALSPTLPLPPPEPVPVVVSIHPAQPVALAPGSLPQTPIYPVGPIHPPEPG